jgi:hypothetical protein
MVCEVVEFDGFRAILCGRSRRQRCKFCGSGYADKLCDFPTGNGRTCDASMCSRCATNIAHEIDYCPQHKGQQPQHQSLFK